MKRAGCKARRADPSIIHELNLTTRYARGELSVQSITDETTNKPDTRIRKIGAIDRLRARGSITEEQYLAAERYAILYEAAEGAHQDVPLDYMRTDCSAVGRDGPTAAQMDALKKLREVHELLGKHLLGILLSVLMANETAKDLSIKFKTDQKRVLGWIECALERMAEHWEFVPVKISA